MRDSGAKKDRCLRTQSPKCLCICKTKPENPLLSKINMQTKFLHFERSM